VNQVRFKEKISSHFPESQEQNDRKNTILIFEQEMHQILKDALCTDCESDAMTLAKASSIICKGVFNYSGFHFNSVFPPGCPQELVPFNLKYIVSMLVYGSNLYQCSTDSQTCLSLSQMILINSKKERT